jgi:hypothetical protein
MRSKQLGFELKSAIFWMAILGFLAIMGAKLMPSYIEYFTVKKMLRAMEEQGDLKGTVRDIRVAFDKRNAIEDVKNVKPDDLEITKEGGEAVVTANWSVRVPLVHNISACLDFTATTAK